MSIGKLYGIGVGPGDPELMTVKGARLLSECKNLFVPKARMKSDSLALEIANRYVGEGTVVTELIFPMVTDKSKLASKWQESATAIAEVLHKGEDVCFLTLGDTLLYSTYIYLVRALKELLPEVEVITIPGITAFSAVASVANFPIGEAKEPVIIIPAEDDLTAVRNAVAGDGTVVLMKIGKRLDAILDILDEYGVLDSGVFAAYVGQQGKERIEFNLRSLRGGGDKNGYLSTIVVRGSGKVKAEE